jgi:hypothetical protein
LFFMDPHVPCAFFFSSYVTLVMSCWEYPERGSRALSVPAERRGLALVRDRLWRTGVQWRIGDHPADSPPICGWPCAQVGCFPPICCTASSAIVRSRSGCGSKPSGARMPRYRVQRAFPDGLQIRLNETGVTACLAVVVGNLTDRISARVAPRNPAWPRVAHASVGR